MRQPYRDRTVEGLRTLQVRAASYLIYQNGGAQPRDAFLGITMSMHLLPAAGAPDETSDSHRALSLISSYENGSVKLWKYHNVAKERSIEGIGWDCVWSSKLHVESGGRTRQPNAKSRGSETSSTHLCCYDSHGDGSFARRLCRIVRVCRPPCWAIRPRRTSRTNTPPFIH